MLVDAPQQPYECRHGRATHAVGAVSPSAAVFRLRQRSGPAGQSDTGETAEEYVWVLPRLDGLGNPDEEAFRGHQLDVVLGDCRPEPALEPVTAHASKKQQRILPALAG